MRHLIIAATFALSLTACDWNTGADYQPKAAYKAFVKKQHEAAKKAAEATPTPGSATPAATGTTPEAAPASDHKPAAESHPAP